MPYVSAYVLLGSGRPVRPLFAGGDMRIQTGILVPLGYGKYVRSDRVTSVVPIEEDRGPGRGPELDQRRQVGQTRLGRPPGGADQVQHVLLDPVVGVHLLHHPPGTQDSLRLHHRGRRGLVGRRQPIQHLPLLGNWIDQYAPRFLLEGLNVNFYFGGTSLLIVVGVAMDTINQVEAQLIMRHYEGFTPRAGRIRGRRSTF